MAQPATGTTMAAGGYNDNDSRFLERGKLMAMFIRDARGAATNISPHNGDGSVNWSPLALDGKLRDDLAAFKKVNGVWQLNPEPNEGFIRFAAFKEGDGPSEKPSMDTDDLMIEQQDEPYDSVRTKNDAPFTVSTVETLNDAWRKLRNDQPFCDANGNLIVQLPGAVTGWGQALGSDPVDRQVLLVREFTRAGKKVHTVKGFSLCRITDIGEVKQSKKDAETAPFTFKPLTDGFFMAKNALGEVVPVIKYEWVGGVDALFGAPVTQYTVDFGASSAGNATFTYGGVGPSSTVVYNPSSAALKTALVGLDDGYAASDWTVTGTAPTFTVTVPSATKALTGDGSGLTGGSLSITPVTS